MNSSGSAGAFPNPIGQAAAKSSGGYGQTDRFRSFAERYIIERASGFIKGKELEEGWQVIQDAKKLYQMIADAAQVDQLPSEDISARLAQQNAPNALQQYNKTMPVATSIEEKIRLAKLIRELSEKGVSIPHSIVGRWLELIKGNMLIRFRHTGANHV